MDNLKGRMIDDVPYSGLVERLCQITILCRIADDPGIEMTMDDLKGFLAQIAQKGTEALAFAGATREEIKATNEYLISGLHLAGDVSPSEEDT